MNKAVFIDKDGTLIRDVPYNVDPALITLEPGVIEGLKLFTRNGYLLIIVSNQSGVARGYFEECALKHVKQKITTLLQKEHIRLDAFYYCPHHPDGTVPAYAIECLCRKPGPGMILKAAAELQVNLHASWMIGDILHDVEAGNRAGCKTVLINNGNETEWVVGNYRTPHFLADNMYEAATRICNSSPVKSV